MLATRWAAFTFQRGHLRLLNGDRSVYSLLAPHLASHTVSSNTQTLNTSRKDRAYWHRNFRFMLFEELLYSSSPSALLAALLVTCVPVRKLAAPGAVCRLHATNAPLQLLACCDAVTLAGKRSTAFGCIFKCTSRRPSW
jgi:hypothetical protein